MRYSKPSNTFFTSTIKNLLVMALATLAVGCGEKDSPSGKHQVTAVIQIHPTKPNFYTTNESFIANEIASLSLGVNLTAAALMGNWESQDIDPNNIQKNLVVTRISGTDMASITLHSDDPDQAKNIIEALIASYLVTRKKNEEDRAQKALDALEREQRSQQDLVADYRKELIVLIQQYGIPYFDGGSAGNRLGLSEQAMFQSARAKLANFETQADQIKIQIDKLVQLTSEELISYAAGLDLPQNQVTAYANQNRQAVDRMLDLSAQGLGRKHPDMVTMNQRAKGALEKAHEEVVALKEVLKTKLDLVEKQVLKMREMVDDRKEDAINLSLKQTNYTQAKEKYEQARGMLREMKFKHSEAEILLKMPRDPITLHETPKKASKPVFPNFTMNLLLGAGVGLIFGIAIALLLEHLDTSVKSLEDVERYLQVPVLAVIPKDVGVLHKQSGMSPDAEAYRILRTNIEFNRKNPDNNSITVVSGGAGEGKSTTLVNLAYVCAQGGYTTLMIDADLRRPRLHTFFDINNSVGLTNYLTTDLALEDVILQTPVDNLYFMPSGILPADAAGILNSRRMSELLQDVKQRFDLVLVDSPPILGVSDAAVLASEVDLTMVVVQHRKLPRNMLMRVKQAVENVGGQVIGVVLNNVDVRSDSQYQYYTSYYTYYAPSNTEENQKPQAMTAHQSSKSEPKSYSSPDTSNDDLY